MPKFSIRSILVWVALVALSTAALVYPSGWWVVISPGLLTALMGFAVTSATLSTGRNRAFWISFCVSTLTFIITMREFDAPVAGWEPTIWGAYVEQPIWRLLNKEDFVPAIHGFSGFGPPGIQQRHRGFLALLRVLISVVFSAATAWATYFFVRQPSNEL